MPHEPSPLPSPSPLPTEREPREPRESTRLRASVVHLPHTWLAVATAEELGARAPLAVTLQGERLVLFRDRGGAPRALLDRCPHRNVPLSLGRVDRTRGTLECKYHGWQFRGDGHCEHIPSLEGPIRDACHARSYACVQRQGLIWVYSTPDSTPRSEPFHFAYDGRDGYTTVAQDVRARGTLFSTLENALDVPHTAFLHRGLFRSQSRGLRIEAHVRRDGHGVEVEYRGEPRPEGLVAKLLSPSGGTVTHFDRFLLPCVAQVEYRIGDENHLLVDSVMTPLDAFYTRIFARVSFRTRVPARLIKPLVKPLALRIFQQDAAILAQQTEAIEHAGGERFASTELDVVGKHMWRLLKHAERGGDPSAIAEVRETATLIL